MRSDKKGAGIFYGWWVIGACFLMALYTAGAIGYSFTGFIEPIAKEFGWSYANISFASSLRGVEQGLFAPVIGYLVDRFGAKPILFIGGIIAGLGVFALGHVKSIGMFYAAFGLIALGLSACSVTAMLAAVALWFRRNASTAMGIMISGWGFAGFMVPIVVRLVDTVGWRRALDVLGMGMFAVVLPLSLIVKRPSGKDLAAINGQDTLREIARRGSTPVSDEVNLSGIQALRCRAFWHLSLAMMAQHLVANAVTTHVMPYLSSVSIARSVASLAATGIPVASILGRFGFGWLGDRMSKKWLTAGGFVLLCVGLIIFSYSNPTMLFLLFFFDIFFGIGFGGTNTMRAVLTRDCFGGKNFATILGFVTGVGTFGSLIGAPLAGYVYDRMKTYRPVWVGFTALAVVCLVTIATMPPVKVDGATKAEEPAEVAGNKR